MFVFFVVAGVALISKSVCVGVSVCVNVGVYNGKFMYVRLCCEE